MRAITQPETYLNAALCALREKDGDWRGALDSLPVPVYTTDDQGSVTYWNHACIAFAGRKPQLGQDKWCVTWRLFTMAGEFMPHDECPMAEAVKEQREVRGNIAIAMRPDGSRRAFVPYPTPLFDDSGNFCGAVNLLIDVSEEQAKQLSDQAARCRRLARSTTDERAARILGDMAGEYAETVAQLRSAD
jgi:PAS domain S-box-containing protein